MNLSAFKQHLASVKYPLFELGNGTHIPAHYHITEIGVVTKKFIDCGGEIRVEEVVTFQIWYSHDVDHRLPAEKLLRIIGIFEEKVSADDYPIEIEYQGETIGKYGILWDNDTFILTPKMTDCLAKDNCGIPEQPSCCNGGCC